MDRRKLAASERKEKRTLKPKKVFSRYKEVTPDRVIERVVQLTRTDDMGLWKFLERRVDHKGTEDSPMDEKAIRERELYVLQRVLAGERKTKGFISSTGLLLRGFISTGRLYSEVMADPQERTSPYREPGEQFLSVSFTGIRDMLLSSVTGLTVLLTDNIFFNSQLEKSIHEHRLESLVPLTIFGVPAIYHFVKNAIIKRTWRSQVEWTYEAVERYGIDGYLTMLLKPWKKFGMLRYLKKLEKKGIINPGGFSPKGEQWYTKKVTPGMESLLELTVGEAQA